MNGESMPGAGDYMSMIASFAPIVILIVLLMRNSIQVGDELSPIGGFIGRVVSIKDDVLVIESSSDRTKLKLYRWAIRGKEAPATESVEAPKEAKETKKDDKY